MAGEAEQQVGGPYLASAGCEAGPLDGEQAARGGRRWPAAELRRYMARGSLDREARKATPGTRDYQRAGEREEAEARNRAARKRFWVGTRRQIRWFRRQAARSPKWRQRLDDALLNAERWALRDSWGEATRERWRGDASAAEKRAADRWLARIAEDAEALGLDPSNPCEPTPDEAAEAQKRDIAFAERRLGRRLLPDEGRRLGRSFRTNELLVYASPPGNSERPPVLRRVRADAARISPRLDRRGRAQLREGIARLAALLASRFLVRAPRRGPPPRLLAPAIADALASLTLAPNAPTRPVVLPGHEVVPLT